MAGSTTTSSTTHHTPHIPHSHAHTLAQRDMPTTSTALRSLAVSLSVLSPRGCVRLVLCSAVRCCVLRCAALRCGLCGDGSESFGMARAQCWWMRCRWICSRVPSSTTQCAWSAAASRCSVTPTPYPSAAAAPPSSRSTSDCGPQPQRPCRRCLTVNTSLPVRLSVPSSICPLDRCISVLCGGERATPRVLVRLLAVGAAVAQPAAHARVRGEVTAH